MSDDAAIRREKLRHLCAVRQWTPADLHMAMDPGSRYSYWRDLLVLPTKPFGEKIARRIEERLELGRGWLDEPLAGSALHRAAEPRTGTPPRPARGPFSPDLMAALARCDAAQLQQMEGMLRALLNMPPLSSTARPAFKLREPATRPPVAKGLKLRASSADSAPTKGSDQRGPGKKGPAK